MPEVVLTFNKGVYKDIPASQIQPGGCSDASHVRFEDGVVRKGLGLAAYEGTAQASEIKELLAFDVSGTARVIAGLKASWRKLTGATTWADIKTGLGGGDDSIITAAAFGRVILLANGVDAMQSFSTPYTATAAISDPPGEVGSVVRVFQRHAFLLACATNQLRLYWSDIDDFDTWTAAADNEAGDIDCYESSTPLIGGEPLGDLMMVYSENMAFAFQYVGGTYVFARQILAHDVGLLKAKLIATADNHQFFMSKRDFYVADSSRVYPIGTGRTRKYVYDLLNTAKIQRGFAFPVKDKKEVWFCVPTGSNNWPNLAVIYNYVSDTYSFDTIDWTAGIDAIPLTLPLVADTDKKLYSTETGDNAVGGGGITAYVDSAEFGGDTPNIHKHITCLYPVVPSSASAATILFYVGSRANTNEAVTWSSAYTFNPSTDYKVDLRESGKLLRLRVRSVAASTPWDVSSVKVMYELGGSR